MTKSSKRRPKFFYGWWIVIGSGTVQFFTSAVFWRGFQAYVDPVLRAFPGWGSGVFGTAMAIQRAESSLITPFVGAAIDRFGPRPVLAFGAFVTGCGFILMSRVQELWHFYAVMLVLGIGLSFGEFIVFVATVVNWFVRYRSRALASFMTFSAMGAVALPLLVWSISTFGWRAVMVGVGIGFWMIAIPAVWLLRRRPEEYGLRPDGDPEPSSSTVDSDPSSLRRPPEVSIGIREVLRLRAFWQIVVAVSIGEVVAMSNLYHLPALLEYEVDLWLASVAAGAVAIGDVSGRVIVGLIGDRFRLKNLLATALGIQVVGVTSLVLINSDILGLSWGLVPLPLFVLCSGLGFGASIPLRLAILADYFGRRSYGTLVGTASSISSLSVTCGLLFIGFMSDFTDSYRPGYMVLAALLLPAVPLMLMLESPRRVAAKVRQMARARMLGVT